MAEIIIPRGGALSREPRRRNRRQRVSFLGGQHGFQVERGHFRHGQVSLCEKIECASPSFQGDARHRATMCNCTSENLEAMCTVQKEKARDRFLWPRAFTFPAMLKICR